MVETNSAAPKIALADPLVSGLYAWTVTVAWPAAERFAPVAARVLGLVAALALVSGTLLFSSWPRLGRTLAIWVFVAACGAVWVLTPQATTPGRLDPVQGALGSLGWALFAISWGASRRRRVDTTSLALIAPRSTLPRRATTAALGGFAVALVPPVLAFWVPERDRALFAHAAALAVAAALASHAVPVAMALSSDRTRGRPRPASWPKALAPAAWPLVLLFGLAFLGAAYSLLR
jgi:hypothetical protein